tara:strand:+ start:132 stop:335 length:204 start_codon:yes stop_codon:yes gene_type:complete
LLKNIQITLEKQHEQSSGQPAAGLSSKSTISEPTTEYAINATELPWAHEPSNDAAVACANATNRSHA